MVFYVYLCVILLFISPAACQYDVISNGKNKPNEINVILFFVNSSDSDQDNCNDADNNDLDDDGTKFLNFSKATVIIPCTPETEAEITGSMNRILRYSQNSCDCENLLKASLKSLIGYARNSLGLTTAISSINEKEIKPKAQFMEVNKNRGSGNVLQFNEKEQSNYQNPHYKKFDPNRWSIKTAKTKRGADVEVFNITSGIKEKREENREIADIPLLQEKPKTVWDAMGLMKTIRQSFFDNFFSPVFDPRKALIEEEDGLNLHLLGRVQEPSMFELVGRTLRQLEIYRSDNGFLVTFFGGKLCDIRNARSDLMRSIKHVLERSDDDNTLAVLTGACPRGGRIGSDEAIEMPLYVRGPKQEVLADAKELFDVPRLVRVAMMQYHKSKKRYNKAPEAKENL